MGGLYIYVLHKMILQVVEKRLLGKGAIRPSETKSCSFFLGGSGLGDIGQVALKIAAEGRVSVKSAMEPDSCVFFPYFR